MKTDEGLKFLGFNPQTKQAWTPLEAYKFCNDPNKDDFANSVKSNRLKVKASLVNMDQKSDPFWYRNKDNFKEAMATIEEMKRR